MKSVLLKRRPRPVELDGGTVHVRSLTLAEIEQMQALARAGDEVATAVFVLSRGLVNADGSQTFEPDAPDVKDLPGDVIAALMEAIGKASKPPSVERLEKN